MPCAVVFPRDDGMTVIGQGPFGMDRELPPEGDGVRRGVKRMLTVPSYSAAPYTARLRCRARREGARSLFAARPSASSAPARCRTAFVEHLKRGRLSNATFVEASDLVDEIKAVKSAEEIDLMRRTARMQDKCMAAAFAAVAPGKKDIEIAAIAEQVGHSLRQRAGPVHGRLGPGRHRRGDGEPPFPGPHAPRRRPVHASWSRATAPAASIPNSAAPASSARRRRR